MRSITAIELGQASCVLARTRRNRAVIEVSAVHGVREGEGALPDVDRGPHLRRLRRKGRFPRRARVVGWGLEEGAAPSDPLTRAALAPLLEAGFALDAVMTPPEALAALARSRPRAAGRGATAWLSLNRHAAAIAIVNGGDLLFSRVFSWNYRPAATMREELLQRYSLVAHLAPELRHGFDVVRGDHGVTVDGIVTCGDLPDLRSLTMPLIEELDMEVETLDSLDGLEIVGTANSPELADRAPALRLACAAAAGRAADSAATSRLVMAAAAAVVLVAVALWGLSWLWPGADGDSRVGNRPPAGSPVASVQPAAPARPASSMAESQRASGPAASQRASDAPVQPAPGAVPSPPAATSRSSSAEPAGTPGEPVEGGGGPEPPSVPAATTGQRGNEPAAVPVAPPAAQPRPPLARPVPPVRPRIEAPQAPKPRAAAPPAPVPQAVEPEPARPIAERPARKPVPLTDPLPMVNSILVAPERRLAVVDGAIVREGDRVGPRVLVRIEPSALILREPSGHEVRVPIRRRLGTDR